MKYRPIRYLQASTRTALRSTLLGLALAAAGVATVAPVQANPGGATRAQVKMDRDTFLAMARWDEATGNWVLREGMPMPAGVPTREEVKAMRDQFLSMHRWDDSRSQWVPTGNVPRDMSKLTREQVKTETAMFLKMYRFDDYRFTWVPRQ